jgi:hypothetical protein
MGEKEFGWETQRSYRLKMRVTGNRIIAWVDDQLQFEVRDENKPLLGGGVAYVVDQGHISSQAMSVKSISWAAQNPNQPETMRLD